MTVRNFLTSVGSVVKHMHGGRGEIIERRLFEPKDFESGWDFAIYLTMEPDSSIGEHQHGDDEEMYIILSGEGEMKLDDKILQVKCGDMILNRRNGRHGLHNQSNEKIDLLVLQVSCPSKLSLGSN